MINAVALRAFSWASCGAIASLLVILFAGYDGAARVIAGAAIAAVIGFALEELVRWALRRKLTASE